MHPTPHRLHRSFPCLSAILLVALGQAQAQTERIWSGATDANFNISSNWVGGVAPGTGTSPSTSTNTDIAVFDGTAALASSTLGSSRNLGGIRFTGANLAGYTVGDGIGSNRFYFTLGGEVAVESNVVNAQALQRVGLSGSTGGYTFRSDAATSTATLTFASSLLSNTTGAANLVLTGSNTGANQITGVISQTAGAGALSLTKNGTGAWVLQGSNTYTGGVTVNDGSLALRNDNALGTGTLTLAGGRVGSVVSGRTIANTISITGNVGFGGAGAGSLTGQQTTFTGAVNLNDGVRTLTIGNTATFSGVISNGGIVLTATSEALSTNLNAANTYAGGTVLNGGILVTGNASALGTGSLTISGGDLRIGSGASSVTLGAGANFAMSAGTWTVQLGNAFDQLIGNAGTFTITGGTLNVDITGAGFGYGNSYQILSSFVGGSVANLSFMALNGGANAVTFESLGYTASLSDTGLLSFTATSIPEPSSFASIIGAGVLATGALRRRRPASV